MRRFNIILIACLCLIGVALVTAQDAPIGEAAACHQPLESIWTMASDGCLGGPAGYFCNGGSAPQVEPAGPVSNALAAVGSLVDINEVTSLRTPVIAPEANVVGAAWLRLSDPPLTGVLLGDVSLRNVTPDGFPEWKSMVVQTGTDTPTCSAAPRNSFVVQSPINEVSRLVINGTSLAMNGTVLVQTTADSTIFVGLAGQTSLLAMGAERPLQTGQQVAVPYAAGNFVTPAGIPSNPQPLDPSLTSNIPTPLLDRPIMLPQPGFVTTQGTVNLRAAPALDGLLLLEVPSGETMSLLGRDSSGEWYHVRLNNGVTGWMFAELLFGTIGTIHAIYQVTPTPLQRFGELGYAARVISPSGVSMRSAPDAAFPAIGTIPDGTRAVLLARSPYSPWVKIDVNGAVGWVALIALDTRAVIDALPIDYDVPPPPATPTPTLIPGSFGNAFPDPRGG